MLSLKSRNVCFYICLIVSNVRAVSVGDRRASVVAEKGKPVGMLVGSASEILKYPDQTIKVREGRVVEITSTPGPRPPSSTGASPTESAPRPASSSDQEPSFSRHFVGDPEFYTTDGERRAGTAFLARQSNSSQIYILTVHHLFGPDGGFPQAISHDKVPSFVKAIRLAELLGNPKYYPVTGCVVPDGVDTNGPLADLAVFKPTEGAEEDAPILATAKPAVGEFVWLIAHVRGGVPEGQITHRAKVVPSETAWLVCEFDNPQIVTNGASGAPMLNSAGRVVGVYSGHISENGRKFAYCIPSQLIVGVLRGLSQNR